MLSKVDFPDQVPHFDAGGGVHKLKPDGEPGRERGASQHALTFPYLYMIIDHCFTIASYIHIVISRTDDHHTIKLPCYHIFIKMTQFQVDTVIADVHGSDLEVFFGQLFRLLFCHTRFVVFPPTFLMHIFFCHFKKMFRS